MILKSLHLENFRSYKNATINFPLGKILFEGDIGSGKSSILYAIEFALFGLGDLKGESLIRVGEKRCFVELTFEINGKEYKIGRMLEKKGRGVSQVEGYLVEDGIKHYYSATELRAKILDLLQFRESVKTKSSSVIFRYAIFTPQEEMKEILNLRAEDRLQTLRRAFGIEDYKIAKDNAKLLLSELKSKIKFIEGELIDLESLQREHKETIEKIANYRKELEKCKVEKEKYEKEVARLEEKLKSLEEQIIEINKLKSEIPLLERELEEKKREVKLLKEENKSLAEKEKEVKGNLEKLKNEIRPIEKSLSELEKEKATLEERKEMKREELAMIKSSINNIEKLINEKVCPTCKRPVEKAEFEQKIEELKKHYGTLGNEILEIKKKIEEIEKQIEEARECERKKNELKRLEDELKSIRERVESNEKKVSSLLVRIEQLEKEIPEKKRKVEESETLAKEVEELEKKKREKEFELKQWISKISSFEGEIKTLEELRARLEEKIESKLKLKEEKSRLEEYVLWIQDYFIPTVDLIEKHVLQNINEEFNSLFQRWFNMLLEGSDINVRIDETFTPIVEQNGYELDINSLSGGERTSVALAYRLALNLLVRKVCTSMKSNLLILDEPTDGFSKEQLYRVRDVLNELNADQLILVSHERELESFADKIFYVRKEAGVSRVEG